jgi:hypothetical protein
MNSINPSHPGWYVTVTHGKKFISHFDGKAWGVGWHDQIAAIGKERLAHHISQKDWLHEIEVLGESPGRPPSWQD